MNFRSQIRWRLSAVNPNVSILDLAEYAFDGGEWQSEEEILRIDNQFREKLGYPLRMEAFAQPWTNDRVEGFEHTLSLRFHIHTEALLEGTFLAMENDEKTKIFLDGKTVENRAEGWYVDHCNPQSSASADESRRT